MKRKFYHEDPLAAVAPVVLPLPAAHAARRAAPEGYLPDRGLVDAVEVALELGQPLLLTGEPGTGKTQLAFSLAWQLKLQTPLKFETKSNSTARDLFYVYNSIGRFHAAHSGDKLTNPVDFITYNALGLAILLAQERERVAKYLPADFQHDGPRRTVVLIDEIDKAPRDFPNDILNELEDMYFRIPELGNVLIDAPRERRPVIVITSNSEKQLPDAFLRRCVYYHVPFPDREGLRRIVSARLEGYVVGANASCGDDDSDFVADAVDFFLQLRGPASGLRKIPATAELLAWIASLRQSSGNGSAAPAVNPLRTDRVAVQRSMGALLKTSEDSQRADKLLEKWFHRSGGSSGG